MSKTWYKYPAVKDYSRNYTSWAKRQASKKVRRTKNIDNGSIYKKYFCSYDIIDYKTVYYNDFEVKESWYTKEKVNYRLCKKSLLNYFRRTPIYSIMDVDGN